nr:DUF21 domain-containing protein At1g47330-like isoform X1 [Ipomoea batatas]
MLISSTYNSSHLTNISTFLQILPHAIIPHYGLKVGAAAAPLVHLLLWIFFPVEAENAGAGSWMHDADEASCIMDQENSAIREFPADQQVEEILDETDEYVNIHNRIKISINTSLEESLLPAGSCSSMRLR